MGVFYLVWFPDNSHQKAIIKYAIFVPMKKVDYIIVGCGLAGIAFCEQLRAHNQSFLVFEDASQHSSSVAVGLYNPVVLKRFTEVWKAKELLELALPKYQILEQLLNATLDYKHPVYRRFSSIEEQNQWFLASDKPKLADYLSTNILKNSSTEIHAPYGFGEVLHSGRIDTAELIKRYRRHLIEQELLIEESFSYDDLIIKNDSILYKEIESKNVIFAEGFGVLKNPYFKTLPLRVAKGEIITIKAPKLKIDFILKASVFIVPLNDNLYAVGATYNWEDKTNVSTDKAKQELLNKLKTIISCEFEVVDHVAGIRPTVKDRRPLVGRHSKCKNVYVLNGLGTRGVMIAPYVANALYNFIEKQMPLDKEIDINRFI